MSFGERLKWAIERVPTSKSALARHLGITAQAVGQWDKANRSPKTLKRLKEAADFLGVSVQFLLGEEDYPDVESMSPAPVPIPAHRLRQNFRSAFAERLRQERRRINLEKIEIAETAGAGLDYVEMWERGEMLPDAFELSRLGAAGFRIDWLLGQPVAARGASKNLPKNAEEDLVLARWRELARPRQQLVLELLQAIPPDPAA